MVDPLDRNEIVKSQQPVEGIGTHGSTSVAKTLDAASPCEKTTGAEKASASIAAVLLARVSFPAPADDQRDGLATELLTEPLVLPTLELDELDDRALPNTTSFRASLASGGGRSNDERGNNGSEDHDTVHGNTPGAEMRGKQRKTR
jgi:hypothetical protein